MIKLFRDNNYTKSPIYKSVGRIDIFPRFRLYDITTGGFHIKISLSLQIYTKETFMNTVS